MEVGDKCICQYDDWYNAFGEVSHVLHLGMRVTVTGVAYVGGTRFLSFEEAPDGNFYMATGFKPLRSLN